MECDKVAPSFWVWYISVVMTPLIYSIKRDRGNWVGSTRINRVWHTPVRWRHLRIIWDLQEDSHLIHHINPFEFWYWREIWKIGDDDFHVGINKTFRSSSLLFLMSTRGHEMNTSEHIYQCLTLDTSFGIGNSWKYSGQKFQRKVIFF